MPADSNPEALFLDHLPLIEEVVRMVCRRRRFSADEAEEFDSSVRLGFIEHDYRVLREFQGRSSLRTFLVTVIQRLALDFVIRKTGKWRPSSRARKLGETAVNLEKLLVRDRLSPGEACQMLAARPDTTESVDELRALAAELPVRRRAREVPLEEAALGAAADPGSPLLSFERLEIDEPEARRIGAVIQEVGGSLSSEDRLLLKLRLESGLTVPRIAPMLAQSPKRVYKRIEWLMQRYRRALEERGIAAATIGPVDCIARLLDLSFGPAGEDARTCPSHLEEGDARAT